MSCRSFIIVNDVEIRGKVQGQHERVQPGQTVWHKDYHEVRLEVICQNGKWLWLREPDKEVGNLYVASDYTATDPNAEPEPQKCPMCGSGAEVRGYANGEWDVRCLESGRRAGSHGCGFKSPFKPTRLEAIQAWNSIRVSKATTQCKVSIAGVRCRLDAGHDGLHEHPGLSPLSGVIDAGKTADSDPLTEEWLRKVGLWDGIKTDMGYSMSAFWPYGFFNSLLLKCRLGNLALDWPAKAKTIGDARTLCRLLGVTIKE